MTEIRINNIGSYNETSIASSEWLLGTSNCVFSDWQVQTYFSIKDKKPVATFVVAPRRFSHEVLFKTDSYEELEKWVNEHLEEINSQIQTKKDKWIEENKNIFTGRVLYPFCIFQKLNIKYPSYDTNCEWDFQDVEDASLLLKAIWRTTRGCNKLKQVLA